MKKKYLIVNANTTEAEKFNDFFNLVNFSFNSVKKQTTISKKKSERASKTRQIDSAAKHGTYWAVSVTLPCVINFYQWGEDFAQEKKQGIFCFQLFFKEWMMSINAVNPLWLLKKD